VAKQPGLAILLADFILSLFNSANPYTNWRLPKDECEARRKSFARSITLMLSAILFSVKIFFDSP
jgi:hypothetical protein